MLKVKNIQLTTERYGDGYECVVEFQVGDMSYSAVKVKLPTEATREIVDNVIAHAIKTFAVVDTAVRVAGEPIPLIDQAPALDPEFAEVETPEPRASDAPAIKGVF